MNPDRLTTAAIRLTTATIRYEKRIGASDGFEPKFVYIAMTPHLKSYAIVAEMDIDEAERDDS